MYNTISDYNLDVQNMNMTGNMIPSQGSQQTSKYTMNRLGHIYDDAD